MVIEPRRVQGFLPALVLVLALLAGGSALAAEPPAGIVNESCPVTPEEWAEPEFTTSYRGSRIDFCCAKCRKQFLEDPERFVPRLPQFGGDPSNPISEPTTATLATTSPTATLSDPVPIPSEPPVATPESLHGHPPPVAGAVSASPRPARPPRTRSWVRFAGKFHPLAVHFPIALILFAALLELLQLSLGWELFAHGTVLTVPAAALGAAVAAALGWAAGTFAHPGDLAGVLTTHRWLGTSTACLAVAAAWFRLRARTEPGRATRIAYRVCLFLAALLVSLAGHTGGMLVFGPDHFTW